MFADKLVIKAMFETYFNIRKENWGLVVEENIKLPEPDSTQMSKIKTCLDLIDELSPVNKSSVAEWLAFVHKVDTAQANELPTLANRLYITEPHLANMLGAINSYIITSMQDEDDFKKEISSLVRRKAIIENAIACRLGGVEAIEANKVQLAKISQQLGLYTPSGIHISYFNNTIKNKDPSATILKETAFEDYVKNAIEGQRNLTLSLKIKAAVAKREADLEKAVSNADTREKNKLISDLRQHSTFKKSPSKKEKEETVEQKDTVRRRRGNASHG